MPDGGLSPTRASFLIVSRSCCQLLSSSPLFGVKSSVNPFPLSEGGPFGALLITESKTNLSSSANWRPSLPPRTDEMFYAFFQHSPVKDRRFNLGLLDGNERPGSKKALHAKRRQNRLFPPPPIFFSFRRCVFRFTVGFSGGSFSEVPVLGPIEFARRRFLYTGPLSERANRPPHSSSFARFPPPTRRRGGGVFG